MTTQQFKTYLSSDGSNRRNFMAWMRERIQSRKMREGTRKGHLTTYKALQRFGKFKTFDDVTLTHIYEFDMFIREEETYTSTGKLIERSQAAIHNYHKRFKSYVSEAFRLGLIKENPYNRFQDKRGEKGKRPHLTKDQIKRLIAIREESADRVANKYLDFFLFQIFTGMAYSDAKSFDYTQHIITVDGHAYIDGHRMKTGEEFITPNPSLYPKDFGTERLQTSHHFQPKVQPIPERCRFGSRLQFSFDHPCGPPHLCLYHQFRRRNP